MALPSVVELVRELVRRPSVNPMGRADVPPEWAHESRVTDYLEAQLRGLGVPVERVEVAPGRCNLVAHYTPPGAPFTVLWEAHQDTVPTDGMTVEPFAAELRDGKVYGRGACDVKGGAAAMLAAFGQLVTTKPPGCAAVTLAFTVDEEHTFLGVQSLMKSGLKPDYAVVAEPTSLNIVSAHKGVVRWAIETSGVAAHSSRPELGVNAIYRMAKVIVALEEYAGVLAHGRRDALLGPGTLSVGMVAGGVSPNTVPDRCRVELDRRLLPGESPAEAIAAVEAFVRQRAGVPFTTLPPVFACPPLSADLSATLVRKLGACIDAVAGTHRVEAMPYGTDASTVAEAGVPVVVFGPGDIAQAHTKDEFIAVDQLHAAVEILVRFATGGVAAS